MIIEALPPLTEQDNSGAQELGQLGRSDGQLGRSRYEVYKQRTILFSWPERYGGPEHPPESLYGGRKTIGLAVKHPTKDFHINWPRTSTGCSITFYPFLYCLWSVCMSLYTIHNSWRTQCEQPAICRRHSSDG